MRRAVVLGALLAVLLAAAAVPRAIDRFAGEGPDPGRGPGLAPARASQAEGPRPPSRRRAPVCRDTLLVGLDGAGELPRKGNRFGPTLASWHRVYARAMRADGRTVEVRRPALATSHPRTLLRRTTGVSTRAVATARVRAWHEQVVPRGVRATLAVLRAAEKGCPEQHVVLVGHAQGASVVHRTLVRLRGKRPATWARVVGAVLVGDGDRGRTRGQELVGAPAAPRVGRGVVARRLGKVAPVPVRGTGATVWNVCTRGDLVCDLRSNSVASGLRAATSYADGAGRAVVRSTARHLAARTRLWPVPRPATTVLSQRTGTVVNRQLTALAASAAVPDLRWQHVSGLPPGLSLSSRGLLTGTLGPLTSATIAYRVHNPATLSSARSGSVVLRSVPATVSLSAAGEVTCETLADRTAWCAGRNDAGQLGDGTTLGHAVPVRVGSSADWTQVSTSGTSTCGIRTDRSLWCWGLNNRGQLGVGGRTNAPTPTPVRVGGSTSWTSVATGWWHTCATRANGTLWCWGRNDRGQLGDGTVDEPRNKPQRVGNGTSWATVSVGGWHTCGTRLDGSAWCWGAGVDGQLGTGDLARRTLPAQIGPDLSWVSVTAAWGHSCGTTADGAAFCWGMGDQGQLGNGSTAARLAPTPVSGGTGWATLAAGDGHTCGLDLQGSAWCWGANRYGQLGADTRTPRLQPTPVTGGRSWMLLSAGWFHGCGIGSNGVPWCWGGNEAGQLGDGTRADRTAPREVG